MITDRELLRRYADDGSEKAFAVVVNRHVDLVYGTALRHLSGNASLAQEVTQEVFTTLAAKPEVARSIRHLSGWLYTTTRFTASHTVRAERRRQDREQKAQSMHAILEKSGSAEHPELPPGILDAVLTALDTDDREAVLLRFFERQSYAAIGLAMGVSEDAARMRVTRALERTRALFARKGITSSAAAVSAALASQAVAAPGALAAGVSAAALAGPAAAAATAGAKLGVAAFMTTTKSIAGLAGAAIIVGLGYSVYQHREATLLREEILNMAEDRASLRKDLQQSVQRSAEIHRRLTDAERRLAGLPERGDAPLAPEPARIRRTPRPASPAAPRPIPAAEKMARMKPLLEAGLPIRGAAIILVDGQPVQRPVEFVMGRETRVDAADEGTYVVTPTLNPDGSIRYAMVLLKRDGENGIERVERLPAVIQTPWEGFILASGGGNVVAFDPDEREP